LRDILGAAFAVEFEQDCSSGLRRALDATHDAVIVDVSQPAEGRPLKVGDLSLFPGARTAHLGDTALRLTAMEYTILEQLMRAAGRPVSRDELCLLLYGRSASPTDRFIDTHIRRIRRKLGERASMILSVRSTGYKLRLPEEMRTATAETWAALQQAGPSQ
jgi:DNA-binding response OmpR family regulator